jgi:MFS-type transporter involved in bile tolerance (Atg22 family)
MGAPSFVAAVVSTYWGSLTSRFSPKVLFMSGLLSYSIIILLMGFVSKGWHYFEVHQGHAMGKPGILEVGAVGRSKRQRDLAHVDADRGA